MRRFAAILASLTLTIVSGCRGKAPEKPAQPTSPTPSATAVTPPAVGAIPGGSPAVQATIPAFIPERLRRPLTDKEIMALPPETRDMILRAQGKPIPTPTKKK